MGAIMIIRASLIAILCVFVSKMYLPQPHKQFSAVYGVAIFVILYGINLFFGSSKVNEKIDRYHELYSEKEGKGTAKERSEGAQELVEDYYDVATDLYEFGWGPCFHFGARFKGEGRMESIRRHEYWLAHQAKIQKGEKWLDLGCGIGGPMRCIARFTEANITGVNITKSQVIRGNQRTKEENMEHLCHIDHGDFMKLPETYGKESVDGCYAFEATCHAPAKIECYKSVFDVLKPGGVFAVFEWVVTDKFDKTNKEHCRIKKGIEQGDALPNLATSTEVVEAMKTAGFDVQEHYDLALRKDLNPVPWYGALEPRYFTTNFKTSIPGWCFTRIMVIILEFFGIAAKGTTRAHAILSIAQEPLSTGGREEIFTPMLFVLAQKPDRKS